MVIFPNPLTLSLKVRISFPNFYPLLMPEYLPLNTLQPPLAVGPPTGPRTGGVLRAAPAVGPRALRPCPLPDRLLRSLRQRVGPKGAGEEEGWVTGEGWEIGEGVVVVKGIGFIIL